MPMIFKERTAIVPSSFLLSNIFSRLSSNMIRGNLTGDATDFGNSNSGIIGDGNKVVSRTSLSIQ